MSEKDVTNMFEWARRRGRQQESSPQGAGEGEGSSSGDLDEGRRPREDARVVARIGGRGSVERFAHQDSNEVGSAQVDDAYIGEGQVTSLLDVIARDVRDSSDDDSGEGQGESDVSEEDKVVNIGVEYKESGGDSGNEEDSPLEAGATVADLPSTGQAADAGFGRRERRGGALDWLAARELAPLLTRSGARRSGNAYNDSMATFRDMSLEELGPIVHSATVGRYGGKLTPDAQGHPSYFLAACDTFLAKWNAEK